MAESKVLVDTIVKHLSDTLQQHDNTIRQLESSLESIQSQIDNRLTTIRTENQDEIQSLQTNLTSLIESKHALWTQLADNMQSLNNGLGDLKTLITHQTTTQSPLPEQTPSDHIPISAHAQPPPTSYPFVNQSTSSPYTFLQQNSPATTIVLPPTASIPTLSGKSTENLRQFLLRIEQYTHTVNHWSRATFLRGISQFLKDDALEWCCQLYHTNTLSTDSTDFCNRFLTQFHSPIRIAQQEQVWVECKQHENETINQFVVRLRSLWLEQKFDEQEPDFIKHLFCKMHPDIFTLMNLPSSLSLNTIIQEAQKVEEILFLRHKEQRQREFQKSKLFLNTNCFSSRPKFVTPSVKSTNITVPSFVETSSRSHPPPSQPLLPSYSSLPQHSRTPITCWRCYETGYYSTDCPLNTATIPSNRVTTTPSDSYAHRPLPPRKSKNE